MRATLRAFYATRDPSKTEEDVERVLFKYAHKCDVLYEVRGGPVRLHKSRSGPVP